MVARNLLVEDNLSSRQIDSARFPPTGVEIISRESLVLGLAGKSSKWRMLCWVTNACCGSFESRSTRTVSSWRQPTNCGKLSFGEAGAVVGTFEASGAVVGTVEELA